MFVSIEDIEGNTVTINTELISFVMEDERNRTTCVALTHGEFELPGLVRDRFFATLRWLKGDPLSLNGLYPLDITLVM